MFNRSRLCRLMQARALSLNRTMRTDITTAVANSCDMTPERAGEEIGYEMDNLRSLASDNSLTYADMEQACLDLGLDLDYVEDMLLMF